MPFDHGAYGLTAVVDGDLHSDEEGREHRSDVAENQRRYEATAVRATRFAVRTINVHIEFKLVRSRSEQVLDASTGSERIMRRSINTCVHAIGRYPFPVTVENNMTTSSLGILPATIAVFALLAIGAIAADMLSHRNTRTISLRRATLWSIFWVAVSLAFAGYLWVAHGKDAASLFVAGYALEKVLSIDNLFVFVAIFTWFKVPDALRHHVQYRGIAGAIVFRLAFAAIGTGLLSLGPWVELAFAAIVAWTAVMLLRSSDSEERNGLLAPHRQLCRAPVFPVWPWKPILCFTRGT